MSAVIQKRPSRGEKAVLVLLGLFLGFGGLESALRLSGYGYNLVRPLPPDRGADFRIYCVGESTTWGIGASDPLRKGYPPQLEKMLQEAYPNLRIQCFFDQMIGQNTAEILRKLPSFIRKYDPDLVIFMVGINNWWNMERTNPLLFSRRTFISRATLRVLGFLEHFRVWKLLKWLRSTLGPEKDRWDYFMPASPEERDVLLPKFKEKDLYAEIAGLDLAEMVKLCRAGGIRTIICTYPCSDDKMAEVHRAVARDLGVPLVDQRAYFRDQVRGVFKESQDWRAAFELVSKEFFSPKDRWHPNDKGYEAVARNIFRCILHNRMIDRSY